MDKLLKVGTIVDIRRCRDAGLKKAPTAKKLGLDRKTVAKYWDGPTEDPEKPRYKQRKRKIDPYMDYITLRLEEWPELSAEQLYQEIVKQGYNGSPRSVRRAVAGVRPQRFREYKPFETLPGEQAQVDWGHLGRIRIDGVEIPLYAFVLTLSWSRVRYVEFVTSLNMATFLASMHRALKYIGGVPQEVVFDNAKTVVAERVGGVIRYNEDLLRMAATYGFQPRACWSNDPESKGKVESGVKHVKRGFFYGRSLTEPLYIVEDRRATKTQVISIEGNRYSVPPAFARKKVRYRRYEDRIELLDGDRVVDRIELMVGRRKSRIEDRHYPAHAQKGTRPSHPLQARFEGLAPSAKAYLKGLSQSRAGHLREQMEQIVDLAERYNPEMFEQAMQRSIGFQVFGYGRLKRILERQAKAPESLRKPPKQGRNKSNVLSGAAVGVEQRETSYYGGNDR